METVMRLVMCNWTWSHFAWEYSDPARLDFTWRGRQISRTLFAQRIFFFFFFFFELGNTSQSRFSQMATCPVQLHPSLMSPKTTINPTPSNPHTLLSHNPPHPRWDCFVLWNFHYVKRIKILHPVNLWFLRSCHWKYELFRHSLWNQSKKTGRPQRLYRATAT